MVEDRRTERGDPEEWGRTLHLLIPAQGQALPRVACGLQTVTMSGRQAVYMCDGEEIQA